VLSAAPDVLEKAKERGTWVSEDWQYVDSLCCALQVNQKVSKTAHIKELNQEIDRLKAELFCTREKNGVYMPAEHFQQREQVSCSPLIPHRDV